MLDRDSRDALKNLAKLGNVLLLFGVFFLLPQVCFGLALDELFLATLP